MVGPLHMVDAQLRHSLNTSRVQNLQALKRQLPGMAVKSSGSGVNLRPDCCVTLGKYLHLSEPQIS